MSEESKKSILAYFNAYRSEVKNVDEALEIVKAYAGTAGAKAEDIPELIESLVHLFVTGERING